MTPEGQVKKLIKETLKKYGIVNAAQAGTSEAKASVGWYTMPTPRGVKGIPDIVGHYRGRFFSIEAKAPNKEPSGFQLLQNDTIKHTGGAAFIVDGEHALNTFKRWVEGR
jgi:hypothetical protein